MSNCVIPGAHILSGNVFDPRSLTELIPDWKAKEAPLTTKVKQDKFFFLTETSSYPYASWILFSFSFSFLFFLCFSLSLSLYLCFHISGL
jgi:flavin-dependent dehydrogenase